VSIRTIKIDTTAVKTLFIAIACIVVIAAFYVVNWGFGNAVAERSDSIELDQIALKMAPSDPLPHRRLAARLNDTFIAADAERSLFEYELAAKLSPNNYLSWLAAGSARERNGDANGAESALRYAEILAPNYTQVQWTLGNFLLRQNKTDEAFVEIKKATISDPKYSAPAAAIAMQIFSNDLDLARNALGRTPRSDAEFAIFAANQKRYDEALNVWNSIPAENKLDLKDQGEKIIAAMLYAKKFSDVLAVRRSIDPGAKAEAGKIHNGGFEETILPEGAKLFDWQIAKGTTPVIGLSDSEKHSGKYSLAMVFNSPNGTIDRTVSQTIVVEPNSSYKFELFYRSNINSVPPIFWEVVNAEDNTIIGSSSPFMNTQTWTPLSMNVTIPENCDGIIIRVAVGKCAALDCSMTGTIWIDDLNLARL